MNTLQVGTYVIQMQRGQVKVVRSAHAGIHYKHWRCTYIEYHCGYTLGLYITYG